jgi:hypothetical protein
MKRLSAWWSLAERACASIVEPRIDVAASDRDIERLLRGSWIVSTIESLAAKLHAAWLDSLCRSLVRRAASFVRT